MQIASSTADVIIDYGSYAVGIDPVILDLVLSGIGEEAMTAGQISGRATTRWESKGSASPGDSATGQAVVGVEVVGDVLVGVQSRVGGGVGVLPHRIDAIGCPLAVHHHRRKEVEQWSSVTEKNDVPAPAVITR